MSLCGSRVVHHNICLLESILKDQLLSEEMNKLWVVELVVVVHVHGLYQLLHLHYHHHHHLHQLLRHTKSGRYICTIFPGRCWFLGHAQCALHMNRNIEHCTVRTVFLGLWPLHSAGRKVLLTLRTLTLHQQMTSCIFTKKHLKQQCIWRQY